MRKIVVFIGIFCILSSSVLLSRGTLELVEKWASIIQNSSNNADLEKIINGLNLLDQNEDSSSQSVENHQDFDPDVDLFIPVSGLKISAPLIDSFVQMAISCPKVSQIFIEVKLLPPASC